MALNKVNYIDGQTLITAKNMNEIQDEVIRLTELIEVPSSGVVKTVNGVEPDENGNVEVEVSEDVVLYTAQTLTEQQKTQVCTNIGAQKTLNFDTTPISGSTNPVTSGGLSSKFATQDENIEMASMAASIAMPGSLKWDGYVGDKECVIVEAGELSEGVPVRVQFVHVSDYVPAILPLIMNQTPTGERTLSALCSMYGLINGGMHQVAEISVQVADDMFIMGEAFAYVPTDGYLVEGIMFPKKGWYFMSMNIYLSGIEIPFMCVNGLKIEGLNFPDSVAVSDASKYFEEVTTVGSNTMYIGDTITWDGNIDGRFYIEMSETQDGLTVTQKLVKMSDSIPTEEDFKNGCSVSINGSFGGEPESETVELTYDNMVAEGFFLEDGFIQAGYALIVPYDNYTFSEPESNISYVFPEAGTYFFNIDATVIGLYMCTTSLTIPGYNFIVKERKTSEVIKAEHLPEALRFGEITMKTRGDTLTWDGNTEGLVTIDNLYKVSDATPTLSDIHRGFSMVVSHSDGRDPETFVCSAEEASRYIVMEDNGMIGFDGLVILTVSLTEDSVTYPSGVYFFKDVGTYISSFTINGYNGFVTTNTELVKIDPKYLPDNIGGGSGLPEVSADDNGKSVSVVDGEWVVKKPSYNDLSDKPNYAGSSSVGGAATSANKLTTARTISLDGAVSGSVSFDGSTNVSITTSNGQHISNRGSGTYYYKLGTMVADNSGNYGNITFSGRLGGWEQSNSANFDVMMLNRSSARDGNTITATVSASGNTVGAFGNCDIVVYRQDDTSEIVYLKLSGYWLYDFDWSVFQHSINYSATNVTPTGTLVWSLSTAPKTILDTSGDFYIKGSKAATISDIEAAIGAAIAASY